MTTEKAKELLQAKLKCRELISLTDIEKGCKNDCDNCEYCYAQGTIGEQIKALRIAIKALEDINGQKL